MCGCTYLEHLSMLNMLNSLQIPRKNHNLLILLSLWRLYLFSQSELNKCCYESCLLEIYFHFDQKPNSKLLVYYFFVCFRVWVFPTFTKSGCKSFKHALQLSYLCAVYSSSTLFKNMYQRNRRRTNISKNKLQTWNLPEVEYQ